MPLTILMPALSPTMEQGTLAKWLKHEGDEIRSGDIIAEIETDKATMEFEAIDEGVLGKILVPDGTENVAVNSPIAVMLEDGETADDLKDIRAETPQPAEAVSDKADKQAEPSAPVETVAPAAQPSLQAQSVPLSGNSRGRIIASPLAKRLAKERGLDLGSLQGLGPRGRIVARDVTEAKVTAQSQSNKFEADAASEEVIKVDGMRKTIAARLVESKQTVPHFYLSVDCALDKLMALRKDINEGAPEGEGTYKVSVNDFVIKALALALMKVPAANAIWAGSTIVRYNQADIGVAVAVEGGLFTPVVRNANAKSLITISNEVKDLAARARQRKLMPEEYQGGVSSVSNLGMYGVKDFSAIINPPQSSILAVGAGEKRALIKNNDIVVATLMTVTLSCDHRVVDGALGAELLAAFKSYIQNPIAMVI